MGEEKLAQQQQQASAVEAGEEEVAGGKKKRKKKGGANAEEEDIAAKDKESAPVAKEGEGSARSSLQREEMKHLKKLREIEAIEKQIENSENGKVDPMQKEKLMRKPEVEKALADVQRQIAEEAAQVE